MKNRLYFAKYGAWALSALMMFSACRTEDPIVESPQPTTPDQELNSLSFEIGNIATQPDSVGTKTILTPGAGGKTLNATWKSNDKAYVVIAGKPSGVFTAKTTEKQTIFTGDIACAQGDKFAFFYPNVNGSSVVKGDSESKLVLNISQQDGELTTIAEKFDFTLAKGTVESVSKASKLAKGVVSSKKNMLTTLLLKFRTDKGEPITDITRLEIEGVDIQATLDLASEAGLQTFGDHKGKIVMENLGSGNGVETIYVALFPGVSKLTFRASRKSDKLSWGGVINQADYNKPSMLIKASPRLYCYMDVDGVKWAMGNLYFDGRAFHVADKQEFLVNDWDLDKPEVNYQRVSQTGNTDLFYYSALMGEDGKYHWDNWSVLFNIRFGYNISGRLYENPQESNWANGSTQWNPVARYGDIAFWATKGAFRLPTREEMIKLTQRKHQYCFVVGKDNKLCYGIAFDMTPDNKHIKENSFIWKTSGTQKTPEVQQKDLKSGEILFLPVGGFRARSEIWGKAVGSKTNRYYLYYQTATAASPTEYYILYSNAAKLTADETIITGKGSNVRPVLNFL